MKSVPWPRRIGQGAAAQLAGVLHRVDGIAAAARTARRPLADGALDAAPDAVFAAVTHWRPEGPEDHLRLRLACLGRCLDGLLDMNVDRVVVAVITNAPEATAATLREHRRGRDDTVPVRTVDRMPEGDWAGPREVLAVRWHPRRWHRRGDYLPWAHVPLLRRAAESERFSHLLYLEDDLLFEDSHLRFWCRYRKPLAALGLIPGFTLFEWLGRERILVGVVTPVDPVVRRQRIPGDYPGLCSHVVNLENPYQAFYVLDRALAAEHFSRPRSALRSRAAMSVPLGVRERAAAGPLFYHVPPGLKSRNVVPVLIEGGRQRLDPECLVEHLPGNYSRDPGSAFGSLKLDDLFTDG